MLIHSCSHSQGVNTDYVAIIGHLSASQMKPVVMRRWLQALKFCVSQLTKDFDMLVGATLVSVFTAVSLVQELACATIVAVII